MLPSNAQDDRAEGSIPLTCWALFLLIHARRFTMSHKKSLRNVPRILAEMFTGYKLGVIPKDLNWYRMYKEEGAEDIIHRILCDESLDYISSTLGVSRDAIYQSIEGCLAKTYSVPNSFLGHNNPHLDSILPNVQDDRAEGSGPLTC
jgi:hypothetical protein